MKRSGKATAKRREPPPQPTMAKRFVAATGAPLSDAEAEIYGPVLEQIARDNNVENVGSLDKHLVYETVEADDTSPLRSFVFNSDDDAAARSYRVDRCALLIRSIRIVSVSIGARSKPQPMFIYDPDHSKRRSGTHERRGHVLTEDARKNDPTFVSAVGWQIRQISEAVARLELLTNARPSPLEIVKLRDSMRKALKVYFDSVAQEAAE